MSCYEWAIKFNKLSNVSSSRKADARKVLNKHWWKPLYDEYLLSLEWEGKRAECIKAHGDKCVGCGSDFNHIHHMSYDRVGNEDPVYDLIPLCSDCHMDIHTDKVGSPDDFLSGMSGVSGYFDNLDKKPC